MTEKNFTIDSAVRNGWDKMKKNFWFFLLIFVIVWAVVIVLTFLQSETINNGILYVIMAAIGITVDLLIGVGIIKISLLINDNKPAKLNNLYIHYRLIGKFFLAMILKIILVGIGFLLLIIPGIYLSVRFRFVGYLIIDKDMGILESFAGSSKMTKGLKWSVLSFEITSLFIFALGLLALVIGLTAAVPTIILAKANMYRFIEKQVKLS